MSIETGGLPKEVEEEAEKFEAGSAGRGTETRETGEGAKDEVSEIMQEINETREELSQATSLTRRIEKSLDQMIKNEKPTEFFTEGAYRESMEKTRNLSRELGGLYLKLGEAKVKNMDFNKPEDRKQLDDAVNNWVTERVTSGKSPDEDHARESLEKAVAGYWVRKEMTPDEREKLNFFQRADSEPKAAWRGVWNDIPEISDRKPGTEIIFTEKAMTALKK